MSARQPAAEKLIEGAGARLDKPLFEIAGTPVSVATLVSIGLVLVLTLIVGKFLTGLFERVLRRRGKTGEGEVKALVRVLRYAIWITGAAIAFSTAGVNLSALFAAGALFAVAVGFALQSIMQNFVAGVILLLERAIKPGDVLEVEGQMVKVQKMGVRTTVARTLDDEDLIIPNSILSQSSVKNFTLRDPEYRVRMRVGVAYSSDMERVQSTLIAAAEGLTWRLPQHEPRALLVEFASSSVDWEVSVWTDDPWRVRTLRSDLQLAVWNGLKAAEITIAFPQVDVHFDPPVARDPRDQNGEPERAG